MSPITFYQAGAWHDFHECIRHMVATEAALVVIPLHENKRNVAEALACSNPDSIRTLPELITHYLESNRGQGIISYHDVESILGAIMTESFVPYLKMEKFRQSYIRTLAEFIGNFRHTVLVSLTEAIAGFKADKLSLKEKDLIKIYSEYEKRLPEYGYDLRSGLEDFLSHTGRENIHSNLGLGKNEKVVFWGFDSLCPLEEEFIFTLLKHLPQMAYFFCADQEAAEQATSIGTSIATLLVRAKPLLPDRSIICPQQEDLFLDLSRSLFRSGEPTLPIWCSEDQKKVIVSQANSRFQEIVTMARQIKELINGGVALAEIRVVAPAYDLYSLILEEVFPEYGIPFSLGKGEPLRCYPLAALILQLVNQGAGANPFPFRDKILASPYVGFGDEVTSAVLAAFQQVAGAELLPQEKLAVCVQSGQYQLDYGYVRNVRQEAYRRVKPLPGTPQLEVIRSYLEMSQGEKTTDKEAEFGRCLVQFYLQSQAERVLAAWPTKMSGREFHEMLQKMLNSFHIGQRKDLSSADYFQLQLCKREQAVLAQIYGIVAEMVTLFDSAGKVPAEKHTLTEFARIFSRMVGEASLDKEEFWWGDSTEAVTIQPVEGGQYKTWEYTFICGLVDGEFPAAESFNFLQPKREGLGLGQRHSTVDHGRNRFYQLVRSTAEGLYLSSPLADNGKRLVPSPLLKEMEKCLPVQNRKKEKLSQKQELSSNDSSLNYEGLPGSQNNEADLGQTVLYSRRENLIFIGKHIDGGYDHVRPILQDLKDSDKAFFDNTADILRFDGLTLNSSQLSEYDGLFGQSPLPSPPFLSALAQLGEEIKNIAFTPAVLERYASCPMRFFFDDILGLRIGPDFDSSTTETGFFVRSLLKEYTAKACAVQAVPPDAPLLFLQAVEQHIQALEKKGADAFLTRFFQGLTAGLGKQTAQRRGLLSAFLAYETSSPDFLTPFWADLKGMVNPGDGPEIWVEVDRVDLAGTTDCLLAYLYTNNGVGTPNGIRRGLRFDLPLAVLLCMNYAAVNSPHLQVGGAGLYQVKTAKGIKRNGYFAFKELQADRQAKSSDKMPVFSGQREGFLAREESALALEKCQEHIQRLYRLMQRGAFHLPLCSAFEQTCGNCSFGRLCRKDQLRLEKLRTAFEGDDSAAENLNVIRAIF